MNFLLFGLFHENVFSCMFGTHLEDTDPSMPLFYIAALYICNLFNMFNILFVISGILKQFFDPVTLNQYNKVFD